jgi:hypothetical protein
MHHIMPSNPGASAGLWPHLKQGVIFPEWFALGNLVSFRTQPNGVLLPNSESLYNHDGKGGSFNEILGR